MGRAEQKRFKNVSSRREIALTGCLSSYDKRTVFIQRRRNPFIWVRIIAQNQCSWTFLLVLLNWPIYVPVFATSVLNRRTHECIPLDTISLTSCIYSFIWNKCSRKTLHVSIHLFAFLRYSKARAWIHQIFSLKLRRMSTGKKVV